MRRYDIAFLTVACVCLIAGVLMGIAMGIAHDFQFSPVHAHMNLVGWTSLALFGLTYRAYPALSESRLALPHVILATVSGVLFPIGIYLSIAFEFPAVAIAASLLWLLSIVLFFANLVRLWTMDTDERQDETSGAQSGPFYVHN